MKTLATLFFILVFGISFSQEMVFDKGKVIDRVTVSDSQGETFQLYLPKSYDPNGLSAIVFIFDPSGVGNYGIRPFIRSAERFNYILVCSNNSKNGPYQQNFDITNRLFTHVFSNFNIDEKQIYAAGFSGGSRLACTVAVLTGAIQGVIGCGAGFPNEMDKKPSPVSQFSYVGLVGDEDMNYQEMFNVKEWLNKFKIDNELFTYADGHRWPPENQIERAFKWLELQSYKRKIRKSNPENVKSFYEEDNVIVDSLIETDQPFRAIMELERIKRNYGPYIVLDSIKTKIKSVKSSKQYKSEIKVRKKIAEKEYELSEKLLEKFRAESIIGVSKDNFDWWRKEFKDLEENYVNSEDYFTKKMGKRLRNRIQAVAVETSMFQRNSKRFDTVLYCDNLLVHLNPKQPYWQIRLAESHAMNNNHKEAKKHLGKAIEMGFKNKDYIKNNKAFNTLFTTSELQDLIMHNQ